jgi:DNA-binding CsgD family transcriptional regulator
VVSRKLVTMSSPQPVPPNVPRRPDLTLRERQVLIAWILDDNKDAVALRLHISSATVRTVVQRVRAKYAAAGRPAPTKAALVARALQDGLIKIDQL